MSFNITGGMSNESLPSVLKGKEPDTEYASITGFVTVTFVPVKATFQAMGFRDLKCCMPPFVVLKLIKCGLAAVPVPLTGLASHQAWP